MYYPFKSISLQWVQILAWSFFYMISVLYLLPQEPVERALINPLISVSLYVLIIYSNASFLIPRLYEKQRYKQYAIALILFFIAMTCLRMFLYHEVYFKYWKEDYFNYTYRHAALAAFSTFLILCISVVFKMALNYFTLLKTQEKLKAQQYQAELNLLKSQIQPHFLFNTLNNIYYEAYKDSPTTAQLIEKLSDVMRYFIDECPQEVVPLSKEIQFINHYIELEKIRMRYPIQLTFDVNISTDHMLPPMLLMPFVENIFKHGTNKRNSDNEAMITLYDKGPFLYFSVRNKIRSEGVPVSEGGFGLRNLKERLELIYLDRFILSTETYGEYFVASLTIPIR